MAQLLAAFHPHPQDGESKMNGKEGLIQPEEDKKNALRVILPGSEDPTQMERSTPECDIHDDGHWIDSVQTTLHTVTGAEVLALTKNSERRRLATMDDANHSEAFDSRFGRTFNVNRIYNDTFLPMPNEKRLIIRDGTPVSTATANLTSIPPSLQERWKKRGEDAFLAMISALYAKVLVMMGLAFPMTEVISPTVSSTSSSYLAFYLYLYFGSILYFLYVFIALVWNKARRGRSALCLMTSIATLLVHSFRADHFVPPFNPDSCASKNGDLESARGSGKDEHGGRIRPRAFSNEMFRTPHHHGSFYLRIGAVAFGVGSMIYSGLEFAQYFEFDISSPCHDILMAITPAARMAFTFIQMYFIFLNAKMTIYENKAIAYFGLMHMLATNMCVWLNVIIEETKHDIFAHHNNGTKHGHHGMENSSHHSIYGPPVTTTTATPHLLHHPVAEALVDTLATYDMYGNELAHRDISASLRDECQRKQIMGSLVQNASPFLFPCAIEYSLICAAILYLMWKNVGISEPYRRGSSVSSTVAARRSRHHYSVDCAKANKGLFLGIFVLVLTIISLLMFFTLNDQSDYKSVAMAEVNVARLALYCMAFISVLVGMFQVRELRFESSRRLGLDDVLLIFGQTGVISYNIFTIIAAFYHFKDGSSDESLLVLLSGLAALLQAVAQTLFILDASRRNTYSADQQRRKPGREVVTFLLVANFAMWTFNTLEKSRADRSIHPVPLQFYGSWPWIIITNVSMPLAIFYRFHSTVVLCEIWKRCYKVKPDYL